MLPRQRRSAQRCLRSSASCHRAITPHMLPAAYERLCRERRRDIRMPARQTRDIRRCLLLIADMLTRDMLTG